MSNTFHKFKAETFDEAYRQMVRALGKDAVVVNTTEVTEGGLFGFLGNKMIELTASVPGPAAPRRPSLPEKKYQEAASVGSDEAVQDTVAYFRRIVADAQSRIARHAAQNQKGDEPNAPSPDTKTPVRPTKPATPAAQDFDAVQRELREMREMLQILVSENPASGMPPEFAECYHGLIEHGVCRKLAGGLVSSVVAGSDLDIIRNPRVFYERLKMEMQKLLCVTGGIKVVKGQRRVVALVGATGVGKTTNLAKLAAIFAVERRARVALVTTDTYRVAAPEQLHVYANIVGLPMQVTHSAEELVKALNLYQDHDLVLIDTAGGSQFNREKIEELYVNLKAVRLDDVILVLSANTQLDELRSTMESFGRLNPTELLFSKLDETRKFGILFTAAVESGLPVGYLSIGQNVPDDIELASVRTIARLLINEGGSLFGSGAKSTGPG
jgi:flagellar biosynthesis protein FlhF